MSSPQDICVDKKGLLYILDSGTDDSGNGRIIVLGNDYKTVKCIITSAEGIANFKGATGIFVDKNGLIYIAVPKTGQVICLEGVETYSPSHDIIAKKRMLISKIDTNNVVQNFQFTPTKVVADNLGRIYIVSQGNLNGLVSLNSNASFGGFVGANKVTLSMVDIFWRAISTSKQRAGQTDFVPVEFSNVYIDNDGFIYTTARGDSKNQMVRKLNMNGTDILPKTELSISGELSPFRNENKNGDSLFVDVAVGPNGLFSCLDSVSGKLFTYDSAGNMVFVFGGLFDNEGTFRKPVAIQWMGNDILILDSDLNRLCVFKPTSYGAYILNAIQYQYEGSFEKSWDEWAKVLKLDENNELACVGVGQALYRNGSYKQAADYFKLGSNKQLYSKAFEAYRKQEAAVVIPWIALAIAVVIFIFLAYKFVVFSIRARKRYLEIKKMISKK
jgi:hypothetical protein